MKLNNYYFNNRTSKGGEIVDTIISYIDQYGYIVLFIYLMLDLIALPLPGQTFMTYVGFLVYQGHLSLGLSIFFATLGSWTGMTITYFIGFKLGLPFLKKYGRYFKIDAERLNKTSKWYGEHGNILLTIGYFLPGIRHFTGYFAGIAQIKFRTFVIFAYSGALVWTTIFIVLGKFLGPQWDKLNSNVKNTILFSALVFAILFIIVFLFKRFKNTRKE